MQKVKILGVDVCTADMNACIEHIQNLLNNDKQHYFVTPNPEIILAAQKDEEFKKILNKASLQTADGAGLLWAAKKLGNRLKERVTGVELLEEICKISPKLGKKVFLLGAAEGVAKTAKEKLEKKIKGLNIVGTHAGSPSEAEETIKRINASEAEILFVAYGAPQQEKWIANNLKKLPRVKLAGGIGGAFDFIAGKVKRAPKWMQNLGIEWLYRLIKEPKKRWKRIYNATIKFPITFLREN